MKSSEVLAALKRPFHPSAVTWKPGSVAKTGERALAMAYGDLRAYQNRLDEVVGGNWDVVYHPWDKDRLIAEVTIYTDDGAIKRSSTGESDGDSERNEIGGTVAEAQAFKRACAMFGLGRYLYTLPSVWADYDREKRTFTPSAKAKLTGILMQHYRQHTAPEQEQQEQVPTWDMGDVPELAHDLPDEQPSRGTEPPPGGGILAKVRAEQAAGSGPASEPQLKMLGRVLAEHFGRGQGESALFAITGVPVSSTDRKVASKLIDKMSRTKWDKESKSAVNNGDYDQRFVDAIVAAVREGGGT